MKKTTKVCLGLGISLFGALALWVAARARTDRNRSENNRASLYSLKKIAEAQVLYRERDADKNGTLEYAPSLEALEAHGLIPPELADGEDRGYTFWVERPDGEAGEFIWYGGADPIPGQGERHVGTNMTGMLFYPDGERCKFARDGSTTAMIISGHGLDDLPPEPH